MINRFVRAFQAPGLRGDLIRGGLGVGALKILSMALGLIVSVVLARSLGAVGFGQYSFVISLFAVLAIPLDQGTRQLVTREVAAYFDASRWTTLRGLNLRATQGVLVGAGILALALWSIAWARATWTASDRWTLIIAIAGVLPLHGLSVLRSSTLRGLGYVVVAQLPEFLVRRVSQLLIVVGLISLQMLNALTAVIGFGIAVLVDFLLSVALLRQRWPKEACAVEREYETRAWLQAWAPFTLIGAAGVLNGHLGILLLGWLGSDEQVAALMIAYRGAELVSISLAVISLVIGPHIIRAQRDGNLPRLQKLYTQSARAALLLAIPIATPLMFWGQQVIPFVFGPDYVGSAASALAVLAGAQLVNAAFGAIGLFLLMSGYERDTLRGHVAALAVNGAVSLVLIPSLGAQGAALGAAIGMLTWNLILAVSMARRLRLRPGVF